MSCGTPLQYIFKILVPVKRKILIEGSWTSQMWLVLLRVFVDPSFKIPGYEVLAVR